MENSKSTMESVDGASQVRALAHFLPVGFGFRPTDDELVNHYLKGKISGSLRPTDFIPEVDVYRLDPWVLQGKSIVQSADKVWHFFVPKPRKYPGWRRQIRATTSGNWKATGEKRTIMKSPAAGSPEIGKKRTFVFYGRGGVRTPWIIHEYCTLNEEDAFLLCRLVKNPDDTLIKTRKKHKNSSSAINGGENSTSPTAGFSSLDAFNSPFSSGAISTSLFVDQPGGGQDMEVVSNYHVEQDGDLEADLSFNEFENIDDDLWEEIKKTWA